MDYMKQLNAFGDCSVGMLLPPTATAIYLRLFLMNNKARWCEWFETTDQRLMIETGIKSGHTIISSRNILKQKGFIDFQQGGKSKPTKYKIVKLYQDQDIVTAKIAPSSAVSSAVSSAPSSALILDKSKREENDNSPACEKVVDEFQNAIHPLTNLSDLEMVRALANDYGSEWCVMAIAEARRAKNGNTAFLPVKYIGTILRNWKQAGGPPGSMAPSPIVPLVDYGEQRRKTQALIRQRDAEMADLARKRMGIS